MTQERPRYYTNRQKQRLLLQHTDTASHVLASQARNVDKPTQQERHPPSLRPSILELSVFRTYLPVGMTPCHRDRDRISLTRSIGKHSVYGVELPPTSSSHPPPATPSNNKNNHRPRAAPPRRQPRYYGCTPRSSRFPGQRPTRSRYLRYLSAGQCRRMRVLLSGV